MHLARRSGLAALVVAAAGFGAVATARADQVAPPPAAAEQDFWEEMLEPSSAEVRTVINNVQTILNQLPGFNDYDPTGKSRERSIDDALGMLRYARRLAPDNLDVIRLLGIVADEGGRSDLARSMLGEVIARTAEPSEVPAEVYMRLGRLQCRLRHYEEAIRLLRQAMASGGGSAASYGSYNVQGPALVTLASALISTGRLPDAIDLLQGFLGHNQYFGAEEPSLQIAFALAVAYDRDEQRTKAFEVLDALISASQGGYGAAAYSALSRLWFVPANDQHYYFALLYESLGYLTEARTEWLAYARGGDEARFRGRALDHVAAVDTLLRERLAQSKPGKRRTPAPSGTRTAAPPPPPAPAPWTVP